MPLGAEAARKNKDKGKEDSQERAFLVGIDVRTRGRGARGTVTAQAQAARDAASAAPAAAQSRRVRDKEGGNPAPTSRAFRSLTRKSRWRNCARWRGARARRVVGEILQRRDRPDPATLIGAGKLEEIAGAAASVNADLLLFDHDLTASQQRNIEKIVHRRVIDRTQLILDIFARHARTREGQLQVELAQLQYMLPRLAGRGVEMSQLGGGIGTRGPGETQLETDRRKIARRVRHVEQQLENVRRIRAQQRQRRESAPVATVALVGYTNAGKSTLFNALTRAAVLASPRMFATLDPTIRAVVLPSKRKVLLSDTVGFIRSLPHTLVSAFRATLEEVQRASLILHVSDASSRLSAEQDAQVEIVLKELEAEKKPRLRVMNKVDLLDEEVAESLMRCAAHDDSVRVCDGGHGAGSAAGAHRRHDRGRPGQPRASARAAERREDAGHARSQGADLFADVQGWGGAAGSGGAGVGGAEGEGVGGQGLRLRYVLK